MNPHVRQTTTSPCPCVAVTQVRGAHARGGQRLVEQHQRQLDGTTGVTAILAAAVLDAPAPTTPNGATSVHRACEYLSTACAVGGVAVAGTMAVATDAHAPVGVALALPSHRGRRCGRPRTCAATERGCTRTCCDRHWPRRGRRVCSQLDCNPSVAATSRQDFVPTARWRQLQTILTAIVGMVVAPLCVEFFRGETHASFDPRLMPPSWGEVTR